MSKFAWSCAPKVPKRRMTSWSPWPRAPHRWLDQLTSGAIASIRGIAQAEGIDGGDVSRFLPLAFLAPGIVEALMNGRQGVELTAEKMRQILPIPCSWREQRHQLNL